MKKEKLIEALHNCVAHCNYCADACVDADDTNDGSLYQDR